MFSDNLCILSATCLLVSPPAVDEEKQLVRDNALVEKYAKAVEEVAQEYHLDMRIYVRRC